MTAIGPTRTSTFLATGVGRRRDAEIADIRRTRNSGPEVAMKYDRRSSIDGHGGTTGRKLAQDQQGFATRLKDVRAYPAKARLRYEVLVANCESGHYGAPRRLRLMKPCSAEAV